MKKVFSADNLVAAGYVRGLLKANNIDCFLKNENLLGGVGELPVFECWPEVWVQDEQDYARAARLVERVLAEDRPAPSSWQCPDCSERLDGQFMQCWNCGAERNAPAT